MRHRSVFWPPTGFAIVIAIIALDRPVAARAQSMDHVFGQWNDQFNSGSYREAERTAKWMVDQSQTQGWLAASLNCLGRAEHALEHYREAEDALRRALAVELDPTNINRGWIPGNLGRTLVAEKKYDDAERFLNQALQEFEKIRGAQSTEAAAVLRNLGWLYHDRGQYEMSEKYQLRAYANRVAELGPDASDVGDSLNSLGDLSRHLKRYDEAKQRLERAIAVQEKARGAEHTEVTAPLSNLAVVYRELADYGRAEALTRRVLAIQEKAYGRDSAAVASTLKDLAGDAEKQKHTAEAKALRERSQAMGERTANKPDAPDNPFRAGQRISVSAESTDVKDGTETIGSMPRGSVLEVKDIRGRWCLIEGKLGDKAVSGWIDSRNATLAAAADLANRPLPQGKPFNSAEGRFTISVPGTPKRVTQTVSGMENIAYTVEAGHGTYLVSYFDVPQGVNLPAATAVQAFVQARKGQVVSEKEFQLDDLYPGKEVLIRLPGDSYSRLRLCAVRSRQYQIILEGDRNIVTSKEADSYFDSFKLD